ncbi:DUF2442 domain-containing protein [Methylomonas rapida]|uniref:DUF2442 domain-containing protein n=1 Tax=Methylomonas rapida TaxID=2963939 RepID=A0ABY7GIW8_9GAMM|nr:DUF2442 domain-containing protein [Methylomonas rapida]WAR44521.1 DUF2442 domain-containing protein [Methylomonas rapida]
MKLIGFKNPWSHANFNLSPIPSDTTANLGEPKSNLWYKNMIISVKAAKYLEAYRLNLVFDTGESGDVDLKDIVFKYDAASPLRDTNNFKLFRLDDWATVVWDCGFDVSPETLYERATSKRVDWFQPEKMTEQ